MNTEKLWAYKAIETRYIGPTNYKGSRVKATEPDGKSVTLSWDSSADSLEMHERAARALCDKMNWKGQLAAGSLKRGYVFVFVNRDFDAENAA